MQPAALVLVQAAVGEIQRCLACVDDTVAVRVRDDVDGWRDGAAALLRGCRRP